MYAMRERCLAWREFSRKFAWLKNGYLPSVAVHRKRGV